MTQEIDDRVETFEEQRRHLFMLAYRMLGTVDDAEDVVQVTWLRWQAADREGLRNVRAWLTTTATRLAIDQADTTAFESLLAEEVELWSDGGGKVAALRKAQIGRPAVLRALNGLARLQPGPIVTEERNINGRVGLWLRTSDGARTLLAFKVRAGRIAGFYLQRNPDKLRSIDNRIWGGCGHSGHRARTISDGAAFRNLTTPTAGA